LSHPIHGPGREDDAACVLHSLQRTAPAVIPGGCAKFSAHEESGPGRKAGPAPSRPCGRDVSRHREPFELELPEELDELLELEFDELLELEFDELFELEFDELFELELLEELDELFEELLDDELRARMIWPATPVTRLPFSTAASGVAAAGALWAPRAAARAAAVSMVSFFMSLSFQTSLQGRSTWPPTQPTSPIGLYSRRSAGRRVTVDPRQTE
jgi:hypothetical protein